MNIIGELAQEITACLSVATVSVIDDPVGAKVVVLIAVMAVKLAIRQIGPGDRFVKCATPRVFLCKVEACWHV